MRIDAGMQVSGVNLSVGQAAAKDRDHTKLVDAAQQFEAMLLQQMLKPFQQGGSGDGSDEDSDGSGSTLSSFGTEAVAKAISKGGGLGIARQIVQKVTKEREDSLGKVNGSAKVPNQAADRLR